MTYLVALSQMDLLVGIMVTGRSTTGRMSKVLTYSIQPLLMVITKDQDGKALTFSLEAIGLYIPPHRTPRHQVIQLIQAIGQPMVDQLGTTRNIIALLALNPQEILNLHLQNLNSRQLITHKTLG